MPSFSMPGLLVDSALLILAFFLARGLWGHVLREEEVVVLVAVALLSSPGAVPFGHFSAGVLLRLAARWSLLLVLLVAFSFVAARNTENADQGFFVLAWGVAAFLALFVAHLLSPSALRLLERSKKRWRVVIIGLNEAASTLAGAIESGAVHRQELAGCFEDRSPERSGVAERLPRLGRLADAADYVRRHRVRCVYITLPVSSAPRMAGLLEQLNDTTASIYFVPNLIQAQMIQCRVALLGGVPMVALCETPFSGGDGALKRAFDLVLTLAAMPLLLLVMGIIAVAIRATSEGPALFKQRRFGLDGEEILVWKFRTMTTVDDGAGEFRQATRGDQRVTPVGRFLRQTSLDELPQFFNVLAGSMSIVGPRPHAVSVNERCRKEIPGYMIRHKVRPGITGWAQVNGHRGGDDLEAMRRRTECDIEYLKSWSLWLDVVILWKTAVLVLGGDKNAY